MSTGSSYYDNVRPLAYPDSDAVLICFDISRPETLDSVIKKVSIFYLIFSSRHFGSAFNMCCDSGEPTGKKNPLCPAQHLLHRLLCRQLAFSWLNNGANQHRGQSLPFWISSKCPRILDPCPSEKHKVRVKNETRGFAARWVWEKYKIRKLAMQPYQRAVVEAVSGELEIALCNPQKFKSVFYAEQLAKWWQFTRIRWPIQMLWYWVAAGLWSRMCFYSWWKTARTHIVT